MATAPVTLAPAPVVKSGFWTKFKKVFLTLFHDLPKWEAFAANSVNAAAPILLDIETFDPALTPIIAPTLAIVKTDFALSGTLINNLEASTSLTNALANIKTNLPTILDLAEVKNSASSTAITAKVTQVLAIVNSIQAAVGELATPAPAAA